MATSQNGGIRYSMPVFDMPRPAYGFGGVGERLVLDSAEVVVRVDETDEFVRVPVRAVLVDDGLTGWVLEIGPYSIVGSDACVLANALERYGQLSGEFRHTDGVEAEQ